MLSQVLRLLCVWFLQLVTVTSWESSSLLPVAALCLLPWLDSVLSCEHSPSPPRIWGGGFQFAAVESGAGDAKVQFSWDTGECSRGPHS